MTVQNHTQEGNPQDFDSHKDNAEADDGQEGHAWADTPQADKDDTQQQQQ
jgi:hypothetical protein